MHRRRRLGAPHIVVILQIFLPGLVAVVIVARLDPARAFTADLALKLLTAESTEVGKTNRWIGAHILRDAGRLTHGVAEVVPVDAGRRGRLDEVAGATRVNQNAVGAVFLGVKQVGAARINVSGWLDV